MTQVVAPLADVRSATLRTPAGAVTGLRVFIWSDRVEAWGVRSGLPVLLHATGVVSIDTGRSPNAPRPGRPWTVLTADGERWSVERGSGCGCGSPLAKLTPTRRAGVQ